MEKSAFEAVIIRNQYYISMYKQLVFIIILLLILILGLIGFISYLYSTPPSPKYFATEPDGVPIEIIPLARPLHTDEFVLEWAKKAVVNIYALDFLTYRKSLQDSDIYFTWTGFADFLNAYKASNNLEAVRAKRQVVSVQITGPGQITFAGQRSSDQPYTWDLNIPATFTYQNSKEDIVKQTGNFILTVSRDSTLRHPNGIAISQLVFKAT